MATQLLIYVAFRLRPAGLNPPSSRGCRPVSGNFHKRHPAHGTQAAVTDTTVSMVLLHDAADDGLYVDWTKLGHCQAQILSHRRRRKRFWCPVLRGTAQNRTRGLNRLRFSPPQCRHRLRFRLTARPLVRPPYYT
ncbi:hypothetical protein BaRGS_00001628 [Batillaria attramentaria]|uniref:Uncharacterized protein n=1 Tax=Batillaria attramentaria TaxID=370345 RepID=A0ABD0M8W6_9CAEN